MNWSEGRFKASADGGPAEKDRSGVNQLKRICVRVLPECGFPGQKVAEPGCAECSHANGTYL